MKILKAMVPSGPAVLKCDAIEHEGKLWLVPEWLDHIASEEQLPVRIVCISLVQHQLTPDSDEWDIVVNVPVPPAVLRGEAEGEDKLRFETIEYPFGFGDPSNDPA